MKGEALITIKTKDGKIKQQIKNTNLVFDLPKLIVKEFLQEADIGLGNTQGFASYSSDNIYCALGAITCYEDWFRSIKVNDVECSTTDFKDWKMPILYGGEIAKAQSGNDRYAYYDANTSNKNGNVMKKVYTWNNCPAFTLKSINLGHFSIQGSCSYNILRDIFGINQNAICKYGKFYFNELGYQRLSTFKNVSYGKLYTKSNFSWSNNKGRKDFEVEISNFGGTQYSDAHYYQSPITALRNNEIAIFRKNNDLTTNEENASNVNYIFIIDANTGNVKRSFPLTQFDGFTGYPYSTPHYASFPFYYVIATDFGSFVMMGKKGQNNEVGIWKIPEQSEMENYSNNEPISIYADLTNIINIGYGISTLNEYIFVGNSSYSTSKTIKINDDTTNPVTVYNYVPFNLSAGSGGYTCCTFAINKFYKKVNYQDALSIPKWYNTTVLNLSEGVEVAQGDTVTIEYTITAN